MKESNFTHLQNHFLIAMPQIEDPFFSTSVVYICEHSEEGAMGLVINKPSPLYMNHLFDSVEKPTPKQFNKKWVLMGGPVQVDRGFLLHSPTGEWQSSSKINDEIAITTSKDIISNLSEDDNNSIKLLVTIGYSSWDKGQLEAEITNNDWLITPADNQILFEMPYFKRYEAALKSLGIKPSSLSICSGHA